MGGPGGGVHQPVTSSLYPSVLRFLEEAGVSAEDDDLFYFRRLKMLGGAGRAPGGPRQISRKLLSWRQSGYPPLAPLGD